MINIFISYSHKDKNIADEIEMVFTATKGVISG